MILQLHISVIGSKMCVNYIRTNRPNMRGNIFYSNDTVTLVYFDHNMGSIAVTLHR